ncbi:MAG: hypothetical protein KatS3mg119_1964 [Rhodothalassiaceae bacterium]|nr:MAG: hypothetical protein KatS3mg119_1964 [Rhodothalassiaceae bacterium]
MTDSAGRVHSMTGYARRRGQAAGFALLLTARSVNARGLDLKIVLPAMLEHLDPRLRALARARLDRGAVQIRVQVTAEEEAEFGALERRLGPLLKLASRLADAGHAGTAPARLDGLIALAGASGERGGVLDEDTERRLAEAVLELAESLIDDLVAMRAEEGAALRETLVAQIAGMRAELESARRHAADALPALRERFRARLEALLADRAVLDENRLEQELALLAMRQDVTEELDRLAIHLDAAAALLAQGGVIGRRLDFLAQELAREANTLTAKAQEPALTASGLALKNLVEQFREQIQNVE